MLTAAVLVRLAIAVSVAAVVPDAPAARERRVEVRTLDELRVAASGAKPGDTILCAPGAYGAFAAEGWQGTDGAPIRLGALDPTKPPVFERGMHLSRCEHIELANLVVRGAPANGINIDDGGTITQPSRHVRLVNVVVEDVGGRANADGIKLSGVDDVTLERCTVRRWGRGGSAVDMVGCHRATIDRCTFEDDPKDLASTGVQAKGGSSDVTIRRSRFVHAGQRAVNAGGSTGRDFFRPALAETGNAEARRVTIEDCTFVGSLAPFAFVGVDGAIARHNTIYLPTKWVFRLLQESTGPAFVPSGNVELSRNLVVYRRGDRLPLVNVGPNTAPDTVRLDATYWFAIDEPGAPPPAGLPIRETNAVGGRDPGFVDAANDDFRLRDGSPAAGYGARDGEPRGPQGNGPSQKSPERP
ncbi:MAG: right-handed parallel beta-helix repeat-containing protein [Phycisphaerae bacterium]|nr:right-handed parallel beta-helix repeat-containing protein [Phycisphaerae bacterium]